MELKQTPEGNQPPMRAPIATQVLAVLLMVSMVVLTFTTTRKDKAWKAWTKQFGMAQVDKADTKKK